ncbi:MAG: cation diffusion facilitator family transporter [Syntrophales bacterium]
MNLTKKQAAGLSVVSNSLLTILKLLVGVISGSMSIIAEAAHSGFDLLASLVAFLSVRASDRPADLEHPYGHSKIENVSGVIESALIFLVALWIIMEAVQKMRGHALVSYLPVGIAVMLVSLGVNIVVSRILYRIARQTRSIALEADAAHLHSDVLTSGGVILMLAVIWLAQFFWKVNLSFLDPFFSVMLALFILRLAWDLLRKSYPSLMDERANPALEEKINRLIKEFCTDCYLFHKLRTRQSGSKVHIDFHLQLTPDTPLERAHLLSHDLIKKIKDEIPESEVIIHIEPIEDETQKK